MKLTAITCLLCLFTSAFAGAESADAEALVSKAIGASLQGDARSALAFLSRAEQSALSPKSQQFYNCMSERFGRPQPTQNTNTISGHFTQKLVSIFRAYWHKALSTPNARAGYTAELDIALKRHLKLQDSATPLDIDKTIRERLRLEGNYALLGQTGVLRELMIWRQEIRIEEPVLMPHGIYKTSVAYLDDVIEPGWARYATCEQRGSGGWMADRTLFAVVPAYDDIQSEQFKVSFLGHETQHFLDLDIYQNMQSWELEYRAKLIELSLAEKTLVTVLQKFIEDQRDDPAFPHSYANHQLINALIAQVGVASANSLYRIAPEQIRQAATSLFNADNQSRQ